MGRDRRIGVYVCHCGTNIAATVNVKEVTEFAASLRGVVVARDYMFMCSDPGQDLIKKDIKDLRKSPSIDVINRLKKQGAKISYTDPLIPFLKLEGLDLESVSLSAKKIKEFDCCLIATDHSNIDYGFILKNAKLIFDTRNVFKKANRKVIKL